MNDLSVTDVTSQVTSHMIYLIAAGVLNTLNTSNGVSDDFIVTVVKNTMSAKIKNKVRTEGAEEEAM